MSINLPGLNGSNPLGYFAALGVLNALSDRGLDAKLAWRQDGTWMPVLHGFDGGLDELVAALDEDRRSCTGEPALMLEYDGNRDVKAPPSIFREYLVQLAKASSPEGRRSVDWASAFATDVAVDMNGNAKPSALHFTSGQQQFLGVAHELQEGVTAADLVEALEGPWRYTRDMSKPRWDSSMNRDWALRASDPSKAGNFGVPGADWLAFRGLAFMAVAPQGRRVATTGCSRGKEGELLRWCLWTAPLARPVVASLVRLDAASMSSAERSGRGISVVFASRIERKNKGYGSFAPAAVEP